MVSIPSILRSNLLKLGNDEERGVSFRLFEAFIHKLFAPTFIIREGFSAFLEYSLYFAKFSLLYFLLFPGPPTRVPIPNFLSYFPHKLENLHNTLIQLMAYAQHTSTACNFGMVREKCGFGSMPTRSLSKWLHNLKNEM